MTFKDPVGLDDTWKYLYWPLQVVMALFTASLLSFYCPFFEHPWQYPSYFCLIPFPSLRQRPFWAMYFTWRTRRTRIISQRSWPWHVSICLPGIRSRNLFLAFFMTVLFSNGLLPVDSCKFWKTIVSALFAVQTGMFLWQVIAMDHWNWNIPAQYTEGLNNPQLYMVIHVCNHL